MAGRDGLNKETTTSHKIEGNGREGSERSKLRTEQVGRGALESRGKDSRQILVCWGQRRGQSVCGKGAVRATVPVT